MPDPYISVVVTAHDRRRYLPDALRSLEHQTLDKDKFEVIVVKNFEDPASDSIIRRNGWKNVVTDVKPLGGKIAIGVEESRGEVITFLEDDDMYAPERLQVVERKFREVKDLVYFHNDQVVVDEDGNVLPSRPAKPLKVDLVIDEKIKRIPCSLDYILALTAAPFNNSSIAIRKSLLKPDDLEALKVLTTGVDLYFYARAFVNNGSLYLTPSALTMYRVHPDSLSGHLVPWAAVTYLREGGLQGLRERVRLARLRIAVARLESAPVLYELAKTNCGPVNAYWQTYIDGRFDWITYSKDALLAGRSSLLELLRVAAIYASLYRRYRKAKLALEAGLSNALEDLTGLSYGAGSALHGDTVEALKDLLAIVYFAIIIGTLKYLLQFLPWSIKKRFLELRLKLELYESLRITANDR